MSRKRKPIALQLAEKCGGTWRAARDGFGWYYTTPTGWTVRPYAEAVLEFDGYSDENFNTVYYSNPEHTGLLGMNGMIFYSGPKFGDRFPMPSPSYL